jgi:hypothetical protein
MRRFDLSSDGAKRRFEFQKRRQLFIRVHNEAPDNAVIRVYDSASKMPNDSAQFSHDSAFIGFSAGEQAD